MAEINARVFEWNGPLGLPEFAGINDDDLAQAFKEALGRHRSEIEAIAANPEPADYANTIVALETAGEALNRVSALFWNRAGADSNEAIQALERDIADATLAILPDTGHALHHAETETILGVIRSLGGPDGGGHDSGGPDGGA